jgi:predicted lipid-binding transport protein (Tim44 family)
MGMSDFQFADLIILGLIALFIFLRLRNTMGKDIGHKPDIQQMRRVFSQEIGNARANAVKSEQDEKADEKAKQAEDAALEAIGDPALLDGIKAISEADASFSLTGFTEGAKSAFEWVLKAYNQADVETLKTLLSPDIFAEFNNAIEAAKANNTKPETTLVSIKETQVTSASLTKNIAHITLRILSEQMSVVRGADGAIIEGNPSDVEVIEDHWTFERDVKSRSPNWLVIET